MDCLEIRKSLLSYVDRELSGEQEREIRIHLEACPCCRRRAGYEERVRAILRDRLAPPPPPPGLRDRICARLRGVNPAGPPVSPAGSFLRPVPAAALLLVSLFLAITGGVLASRLPQGGLSRGVAVRLTGRLVCLGCEREGVPPALQRRCAEAGHVTGLKTMDGRLLRLTGDGRTPFQRDPDLRGKEVDLEGILDSAAGTLEVRNLSPP